MMSLHVVDDVTDVERWRF